MATRHVLATTIRVSGKVLGATAALLAPLLGFWLSSSLAAYRNGSLLLALVLGLLLFPTAPVAWELIARWRRRRRADARPPILTTFDRLILRTLAINVAFIATVLAVSPRSAFRALATRGDWMLEGHDGATANRLRGYLFAIADDLEGLYGTAGNTYGRSDRAPSTPTIYTGGHWPSPPEPQASRDTIPPDLEHDLRAVARYLVAQEPDDFARVKALHDYVVDRLAYDHDAADGNIARPPQDADAVFAAGTGVCEGYARLLAAMGAAAGVEIAYVTGVSHGSTDWEWNIEGSGHAWNAARIDGAWYLIDATWDDGDGDEDYGTEYLFTPPEVFGVTHLPDDARWQLRDAPMSLADFMRQPVTRPSFAAHGLSLRTPTRSQITVTGRVDIVIDNPREVMLLAGAVERGHSDDARRDCEVTPGSVTRITCELEGNRQYAVTVFVPDPDGDAIFSGAATLLVNAR